MSFKFVEFIRNGKLIDSFVVLLWFPFVKKSLSCCPSLIVFYPQTYLVFAIIEKFTGTSLKLVFITNYILDKTISVKYFLLTNHDP